MNRAVRHLLYGFAWLVGFIVLALAVASSWDLSDLGRNQFRGQVGSLIWVLGFAAIFFSWARVDVAEHGKPRGAALLFAALWPFLVFIAHIGYLFYTRGLRSGLVASLKFVCYLLAVAIALAGAGQVARLVIA